jgi:hypothetical protein
MLDLSDAEIFLLCVALFYGAIGLWAKFGTSKHKLYRPRAEAAGLVMLTSLCAMAWILYVLYNHADPSVVGFYRFFYAALGMGTLYLFGLKIAPRAIGARHAVDVLERNNMAAAVLVSSFLLATGMIYGNSLWGDADPSGGDIGGWYIPVGFFIMGWSTLWASSWLYRIRAWGDVKRRASQIRDPLQTSGFAVYILSAGWILSEAVAGDFYGWGHGIAAVAAIAAMLIIHEMIDIYIERNDSKHPRAMTALELISCIAISVGYTVFYTYFAPMLGID